MNANEVEVGFLRIEGGRATGVRVMHADMLGRVARWLGQNDMAAGIPYVTGWINPASQDPPSPAHARALRKQLEEALAATANRKEQAYLEAALFCVDAWARLPA